MLDYVSDSLIYMCCAKLILLLLLSRFSHVRLCATLWTAAHQALLSMGFFRQEYWNGLSFSSPLSCFSRVQLFVTLWTVVHQSPLSMGFSRQKYWSGLLCLSPGDLPNPGIEPRFLHCGQILYPLSPGSPVGTPQFHCWGPWLNFWWGNSNLTSCTAQSKE